jgi:hypothetical protein
MLMGVRTEIDGEVTSRKHCDANVDDCSAARIHGESLMAFFQRLAKGSNNWIA